MTSPEQWRAAQRVLDGALDLPPDSRAAYVTAQCGADAALRERVEQLLRACARAEQTGGFLASPAVRFAAPMLADLTVHNAERRAALADTLRPALADRYPIIRELGHGGMATVFLARDLRHDRAVAVKVLARDLVEPTGVARFLHEIRVTARLNHPHILPVHDSGEAEGLLYYVMPYVEGETLRARLSREGALPVADVTFLLREMADALACAHAHGVVHRDLKPENILLSGRHAVVADFGIAKALTAAAEPRPGLNPAFASAGVVLGTAAYLAPEQAVGHTAVDHRADLYALGIVGYELLAGVHPFGARSPQALVTAHLSEVPRPLRDLRPEVPPRLAALVMQCLAKIPSERPGSAEVVLAVLDQAMRESAGAGPRKSRLALRRALAALGLMALIITGYLAIGSDGRLPGIGGSGEREPLLVADFSVAGPDSAIGPQLGSAFARYLGESRVVYILPQSRVAAALQRMQRPAGTPLDPGLAREVAQREGLRAVVVGKLAPLGAGYLVTVRLVTAAGDEQASFHATAPGPEAIIPVLDKLGRELRGRIGESLRDVRSSPPLDRMTTSSLEALRKYGEGRTTLDVRRAVTLFREAVALDSTFAIAHLALAIALNNYGLSPAARDSALLRAYRLRDRLTEMERAAVTAMYWILAGHDRNRAIVAYEAQVARDSTDWRAILNLGVLLNQTRQFARTESLMRRYEGVVEWRGADNLAHAQIAQGRYAEADSILMLDQQRRPDLRSPGLWSITAALGGLRLDSAEARAARSYAALPNPESRMLPIQHLARIARVRGRLANADRLISELQAIRAGAGMMPGPLSDSLDGVRQDLWLRGNLARARARLDAVLAVHPIASLGTLDEKVDAVDAAGLYAVAGRPDRARALLEEIRATTDSLAWRAALPWREAALGEIALAEGRPFEAMDRFRRSDTASDGLPVSACSVCVLPGLARAAEQAGWADSARIFWDRYVTPPSLERIETDQWFLALAYRKLSLLYAATGERVKAANYARQFAGLWQEADADLRIMARRP